MTESKFISDSSDLDTIMAPRIWFRSAGNKIFGSGRNHIGQLGTNNTTNRSSPSQEASQSGAWLSVSGGGDFTIALKTNGSLWSWGCNSSGQLGQNNTTNRSLPTQEVSNSTWCVAKAGNTFAHAIKEDGSLWSWGSSACFALGTGQTELNKSSPVREFSNSNNWVTSDASFCFSSAIKSDGSLWSWGLNNFGQIGDNSTSNNRCSPTREVSSSSNWKSVALGVEHTVALKTDGTIWAWGRNESGRLGNNSSTNNSSPVQEFTNSTNWTSVSAGGQTSVATKDDNSLWLWGETRIQTVGAVCIPTQETTLSLDWHKHSPGCIAVAAVKKDGTIWGWGTNTNGVLGNNSTSTVAAPTRLNIDTTVKDVSMNKTAAPALHTIRMSDTLS